MTDTPTKDDGLPREELAHPIPEAFEQGVRDHVARHRRDVALMREVALPFLEPTTPPAAPICDSGAESDAGAH